MATKIGFLGGEVTLSLLHHCCWSREMGFAEAAIDGQELGNEMVRLA